jgi:lysophospholipase L1-like esterase
MSRAKRIVFGLALLWAVATLPVMMTVAVNEHTRFMLLETWAHWRGKAGPLEFVFIGDSLTAGGRNWGLRLTGNPLSARNLGANGLMIRQVADLVKTAKLYQPRHLFLMAGINDLLVAREPLPSLVEDYRELLRQAKAASAQPIVTLVFPTTVRELAAPVAALNAELRALCAAEGVPVIDVTPTVAPDGVLLPEYTTDGVHLTEAAYDVWTAAIKRQLDS